MSLFLHRKGHLLSTCSAQKAVFLFPEENRTPLGWRESLFHLSEREEPTFGAFLCRWKSLVDFPQFVCLLMALRAICQPKAPISCRNFISFLARQVFVLAARIWPLDNIWPAFSLPILFWANGSLESRRKTSRNLSGGLEKSCKTCKISPKNAFGIFEKSTKSVSSRTPTGKLAELAGWALLASPKFETD